MWTIYALFIVLFLTYKFHQRSTKNTWQSKGLRPLPQPLGGYWYIGHFFQLGESPHRTLTKWSKSLGEIYMIRLGQVNTVVINSDKVHSDLVSKRGAIYSSRPPSYLYNEVACRSASIAMLPHGPKFKKLQAIFYKTLNPRKIASYSQVISESVTNLLADLYRAQYDNPNGMYPRVYYCQASMNIILNVGFGLKTKDIHDPLFKKLDEYVYDAFQFFSIPNRVGEFFPILEYNPFSRARQQANACRDATDRIMGELLQSVKDDKDKKPSFMREVWEDEKENMSELEISHIASPLLLGGSNTISTSVDWLTAVLANDPQMQKELHEELDRVIGHSRLPVVSDEQSLPLINSLILEGQRMYCPIWLGLPHFIEQDDEYEGYHIPANSMVLLNTHAIHHDQKRYPNPEIFDLRRFVHDKQTKDSSEKRDHYGFGGGRRLCPGMHLGEAELFLIVSRLLWCYRIENASLLGPDGNPIPIDLTKEHNSTTVRPHAYLVKFVPRHEGVTKVLFPNGELLY